MNRTRLKKFSSEKLGRLSRVSSYFLRNYFLFAFKTGCYADRKMHYFLCVSFCYTAQTFLFKPNNFLTF